MGNIAVLLSGSGRTLANIIERIPGIDVSVVVSSRKDVYGITVAKENNIPAFVVERSECSSTKEFSDMINEIILRYKPDLIVLAGFLSLYQFPEGYENRVMNIHPALIPAFSGKGYYGDKVHKAVCEKGVKVTCCTVHFLDRMYDNGPIIIQKTCSVSSTDTPHEIAARVFELECQAYPEAIDLYMAGRLAVKEGKVHITYG